MIIIMIIVMIIIMIIIIIIIIDQQFDWPLRLFLTNLDKCSPLANIHPIFTIFSEHSDGLP